MSLAGSYTEVSSSKTRKLPAWMEGRAQAIGSEGDGKRPEVVALTPYTYSGQVTVCTDAQHASQLCDGIRAGIGTGSSLQVALDMEWPVIYQVGVQPRTALLQLMPEQSHPHLIHLAAMSQFPEGLWRLLYDDRVKLIGLNIEGDVWKLARDFDLEVRPVIRRCVDLSSLANTTLNSSERWSLENLAAHVLSLKMDKNAEVRKGNWAERVLTEAQVKYAAGDVVVSLMIFDKLHLKQSLKPS